VGWFYSWDCFCNQGESTAQEMSIPVPDQFQEDK
jgi:hypothetical protein